MVRRLRQAASRRLPGSSCLPVIRLVLVVACSFSFASGAEDSIWHSVKWNGERAVASEIPGWRAIVSLKPAPWSANSIKAFHAGLGRVFEIARPVAAGLRACRVCHAMSQHHRHGGLCLLDPRINSQTLLNWAGPESFIELEPLAPSFSAGGAASFAVVLEGNKP